ncbi:MAG TPA: hypothetical protein VGC97_10710 [Pyrinomonadaceae bacterium]|jgi:hypothetical protein
MKVELKAVESPDKNILTEMYFDSIDRSPARWKTLVSQNIIRIAFIRKYLFYREYSPKLVSSWLVLLEGKIIGFAILSWIDNEKKYDCRLEIYVKPGFPRKNIEDRIFVKTLNFCMKEKLSFSFSS